MKFNEVLAFINPILFYIPAIYGISKVFELTFGFENIWSTIWDNFVEIFGKNEELYAVWLPNFLILQLTLVLGLFFYIIETATTQNWLAKYKIQKDKSFKNIADILKVKKMFKTGKK
jgi:hypothetical protein